jgi:restriction endonuclease S subunit
VLKDHSIKHRILTKNADQGSFNLYSASVDILRYSTAEFKDQPFLIQGAVGTIAKATHYCDTPFAVSNNVFVLSSQDPDKYNLKYVYYYLKLTEIANTKVKSAVYPLLTKTVYHEIEIPVPDSAVQADLVQSLDSLQTQIQQLEALEAQTKNTGKLILQNYLGPR